MSDTNTGGPAFPRAPFEYIDNSSGLDWAVREQSGMTLRDYFAGQVLIGLSIRREGATNENDARNAYALADAMLKAREA
jgi:hypothetical protein